MLRQALELAPTSKIILSTDAHFFPETYWLGLRQLRESLEKVLVSYVEAGDFSVSQAINIATDLLFWNSNSLYNLNEERKYPHLLTACGRSTEEPPTLVNGTPESPQSKRTESSLRLSSRSTLRDQPIDSLEDEGSAFTTVDTFFSKNPDIRYVWFQWIDYTNTMRRKMMPVGEFVDTVKKQKRIGAPMAILRMLQRDYIAPGGTATGQLLFSIDVSTLSRNKGLPAEAAPSATVQTFWHEDRPGSIKDAPHLEGCPRWSLQRQVEAAESEFGLSLLMGFEIEIIFMKPVKDPETGYIKEFVSVTDMHSWCNMTYAQLDILPMIEEIVETLAASGIHLPQFHSEAAPGQWEFILPPYPPLQSVDNLYRARTIIGNIARKHGLKATVYPRPFDFTCGTACHAHFSISDATYETCWLAGILDHLPSILAFTLPVLASYERVKGGIWAGGEWVTWGWQNKEVPLRKVEDGRFEMKTVDGMANGYFAMASVIAAGLDGIRNRKPLIHKDCKFDASQIDEETRKNLGITTRLPNTLHKALEILKADELMNKELGEGFIENYIATKLEEDRMLGAMTPEGARKFLMERY
ncbi:putative extracellular developmental signal biosynthesis protein [Phaeomoniella chlamydospora]|uniref:Putative extracellular developmental signal biosynthesis protein n=1 Tax=Phaeomoniella chlamydospora TaxID=158046 RepID=A0A0G2E9S5_PHACM|nr:putative extracellular developmental signal biosynthesis protein [Phaeomoniella chlamydospora]